jgi:hypothetical protein
MLLTPTFIGSLIAGIACWLLFWFGISHLDPNRYRLYSSASAALVRPCHNRAIIAGTSIGNNYRRRKY